MRLCKRSSASALFEYWDWDRRALDGPLHSIQSGGKRYSMAVCTPVVKDFTKMEWRVLLLALTEGLDGRWMGITR